MQIETRHTYLDWLVESYANQPKEQPVTDPTKTYRTRSGLEVRNIRKNQSSNRDRYPWLADVLEDDGLHSLTFTATGQWVHGRKERYDLIEVPQPKEQPVTDKPKLDFTKPETLQRRDGGEFRIYATDHEGMEAIVGAVEEGGRWFVQTWSRNGKTAHAYETGYDLIPKPVRVTGWMNAYPTMNPGSPFWLWDTKEKAAENAGQHCIGQFHIDAEVQQ